MAEWGWFFMLLLVYAALERRRLSDCGRFFRQAWVLGYEEGRRDSRVVLFLTYDQLKARAAERLEARRWML